MRTLRTILTTALILTALGVGTAFAQITDITDIQVYDAAGVPASPFDGQLVTIQGVCTLEAGTLNGGTIYFQDSTGGLSIFDPGAPTILLGEEWQVTGTVGMFSGEIQLTNVGAAYTPISNPGPLSAEVVTVSDLVPTTAAGWELVGRLVESTGFVSDTNFATGQGTFGLTDASGDTATIFIDRTTGIDVSVVVVDEEIQVTGVASNFNGLMEPKPRTQTDLVPNPSNPAPVITDISPAPWTPEAGQSVDVSATITDNTGIANATIYYRDTGGGAFNTVAMANGLGDTYSATIPGTNADGLDYYIEAEDDTGEFATNPGAAPASFLQLAVGTTTIVEIQSSLDVDGDTSLFNGMLVNIEGIITMQPGELQTGLLSQYIVGEPSGERWSGIFVFESSGSNVFFRGDRVRISGTVNEFSGTTQILPQAPSAVELQDFGNPLPTIYPVFTTEMDTTEAWEMVIVRSFMSAVEDTIFGGVDWLLNDDVGDSSIYVDPAVATTYIATVGETQITTGLLDTRFGRNELVPRDDDDIEPFATAIGPVTPSRQQFAEINDAIPNPFNPSTTIKFDTPRKGLSELAIFNARGMRVRTLHKGVLDGGSHERSWNGRDDTGVIVASGVYHARLRFETDQPSVVKLTLLK